MNELEAFRSAARDKDLPDDVISWWLGRARPCLDLTRTGRGPVAGHFGGRPALPAGVAWPGRGLHLASIDLATIPPGTLDLGLPDTGTLLFFAERSDLPRSGRVIHVPAGTPVAEAEPPAAGWPVYDRFPMRGVPRRCLPESYEDSHLERYDEDLLDELCDIVWDLDDETAGRVPAVAVLGGYGSANTGGLGVPVESFETDALLAEFFLTEDEVGKDFQTDLTTVFFVLGRDDLAAHRFDRADVAADFHG